MPMEARERERERDERTSAASRCCSQCLVLSLSLSHTRTRSHTTNTHTGKVAPFVPPPEGGRLHLSQAVLVPPREKEGSEGSEGNFHCLVFYRARGEGSSGRGDKGGSSPELALAALRCGSAASAASSSSSSCDNVPLDLIFDEYTGENT